MTDRSQFSEDIKTNPNLANRIPQCMLDRPKLVSGSPLTDDELKIAKSDLINDSYVKREYPRTVRLRKDPAISQQNFCIITFTPSKGATPDADKCFGIVKVRGGFNTADDASEYAESLIRNVDSYNENYITYMGQEFPLSSDDRYVCTTSDVDLRSKIDSVAREAMRAARETEKREMKEIEDRHRKLLEDTTEKKDDSVPDDMELYLTVKTKIGDLRSRVDQCQNNIKEYTNLLRKTNEELERLDRENPNFKDEWQEKYKTAVENIGGTAHGNKMIEYMK